MMYDLYTLDNEFMFSTSIIPDYFTGISLMNKRVKVWWLNGERHRLDGPAIDCKDSYKEWWLNDKLVTEEQHKLYVDMMKLKGLL